MKTSTIFAFLGGAVLGVAAALVLAPDSGAKTRKKIKRKLKKFSAGLNPSELEELIGRLKFQHAKKKIRDII